MRLCLLILALAARQPVEGDPVALAYAEGFAPYQHRMLPPQAGFVLGSYGADVSRPRTQRACWWDADTGELHDLGAEFEAGGSTYRPAVPQPGVDAGGSVVVGCVRLSGDGPFWITAVVREPALARSADFNGDGEVDTLDFAAFLNAWSEQRGTP